METLSFEQSIVKRCFDICLSLTLLLLLGWVIVVSWIVTTVNMRSNGFFIQKRVGLNGDCFKIFKIKTMSTIIGCNTTVTQVGDPRVTRLGALLRRYKIDELPQLVNVLFGRMSFVGPRPDVSGFANKLQGKEKLILTVRPGITGPATLKYRDEEILLSMQADPERYNREVIWPAKVQINLDYVQNWSFLKDLQYILKTVVKK